MTLLKRNEFFDVISDAVDRFKVDVRLKSRMQDEVGEWSSWLIFPCDGYVEVKGAGPTLASLVEWVEIRAAREEYVGRLVPPKLTDCSQQIIAYLNEHGVGCNFFGGDVIFVNAVTP